MRSNANYINIDAGILSSVVLLGAYRTADAADGDCPDKIRLTGTVRDFKDRTIPGGHTDFERTPDHGFGLYSGNVGLFLGPDGRPVFTGNGRKINQDARDAAGRAIAPHLANRRFGESSPPAPHECEILKDSKGVDAYEVCLVDAVFNGDGTSTWTYRVRELGTGRDLSHWNLKLDPSQVVMPGTTPGYDHGLDGSTGFYGIKWDLSDSFADGEFTVVLGGHYGGGNDDEGVLAKGGPNNPDRGRIFGPTAELSEAGSPFDGSTGLVEDETLDDDDAMVGFSDTGGIESAESFGTWYRDVLGLNLSKPLSITLVKQDDGSYVFDDTEDEYYAEAGGFFPIDDTLFGNSGGTPDRNFHFTFEIHAEFTYDAGAGQIFKFIGDDDVWVYIDGKLAIDLGGVHSAHEQHADLSRMGLVDGETYTLDFFFAERHRTQSNFRIETNLCLESNGMKLPSMTMACD